jgi:hypothetical protein
MTPTRPGSNPPVVGPGGVFLVAMTVALALLSAWPAPVALVVAALGLLGGVGLRQALPASARLVALGPVLGALVALGASAPLGVGAEGVAGFAGVAVIAWLTEDPDRPVGSFVRRVPSWAVPALGVGIAWAGAALLPSGAAPLGVAVGLLVAALAALAYLVRRPELLDRDRAPTL